MQIKLIAIVAGACLAAGPVLAQDASIAAVCASAVPKSSAFDDQTHKLWYNRFWTGKCAPGLSWCSAGTPNWLTTLNELEAAVPEAKRAALRPTLCALGYKVGMEWARDNGVRRIDTGDVAAFYKTLRNTSLPVQTRISDVEKRAADLLK